jgi:hypothetical protein
MTPIETNKSNQTNKRKKSGNNEIKIFILEIVLSAFQINIF